MQPASPPPTIPLWPDAAPGALGDNPALSLFPAAPDKATGAAMVIFPGGGYVGLSDHEGEGYARWLANLGITGFVVKYRLGAHGYRHPAMLHDAARAVRLVRARAAEWKIDPARVGVMGSSAGGHLAATLLVHFDDGIPGANDPVARQSSRPGLGILCYPVITMGEKTHAGSRDNVIGADAPQALRELLSCERQVTPGTPPCFIWHTWEDDGVPAENSQMFAAALKEAGVPFELHIYEKGAHGIGLAATPDGRMHRWTSACRAWLQERGYARA
ncbi:alpha/beta hydrolase [Termitidicoccus mucosus]|uniref:Endo-1,4-beta-xylanase n=1 Tax=Termitidicoccus mucosus TaxID=1184151 RepID=A0A178IL24_9BACT|nr:endo-1,4-beta-xylanase [Opitutaceae bacterium TSB47]